MIGRVISHYEILERIGSGGMGEVYVARDKKLDRRVALKVLPPETSCAGERRARFEREAKAIAALAHPGIVTLHSIEEAEGICFLTMELVSGEPLGSAIPEEGLEPKDFFALAIPLAEAVAAAHECGIVHRDLKPANVMVTRDGRVKVLDFGLAKIEPERVDESPGSDTRATQTELTRDRVVGTVPYMSPEQIEGKSIDTRSDVFSLGILLYEMCTGQRPFKGESAAGHMASILRDPPPPIPEPRSATLPGLEPVLIRCLEKDRGRRYANGRELLDAVVAVRGAPGFSESGTKPSTVSVGDVLGRPAIAVLPFANLGGEAEDEYLIDGITQDIATALSYWRWFPVIAINSTRVYKGRDVDARLVGRELEARYVLEGSVRRAGERLRISAQLLNAETGHQLWAQRYDRKLSDVFEFQDEISERIVGSIEPQLSRAEQQRALRKLPESLDAWDCCLRAMTHIYRHRKNDLLQARELLERAIELDPGSNQAYSWLAVVHYETAMAGWSDDPGGSFAASFRAASSAVDLDGGDWMAHYMLGMGYLWTRRDHELGIDENRTAVALNPSAPLAHHGLACLLEYSGCWEEAISELHTVLRLDPHYQYKSVVLSDLALSHLMLRDFDESRKFAEKAVRSFPHYVRGHQRLASCLGHMGRIEEAGEVGRGLLKRQQDFSAAYVESTYPFKSPADLDFFMEGLRKASLLELGA